MDRKCKCDFEYLLEWDVKRLGKILQTTKNGFGDDKKQKQLYLITDYVSHWGNEDPPEIIEENENKFLNTLQLAIVSKRC